MTKRNNSNNNNTIIVISDPNVSHNFIRDQYSNHYQFIYKREIVMNGCKGTPLLGKISK